MGIHLNKKIAPVVVAVCLAAYYVLSVIILVRLNVPLIITIASLIVSVIISAATVMVLVERIKEINKGETDDLSKY
ncbi:MAG: hypothetical protein LBI40_00795 [Treponema sp.]|nr:hypothetical protein [Treponema sp.]